MSSLIFYREQAAHQQSAADIATLANVRDRCQRAADAWTVLAERTERSDQARLQIAAEKMPRPDAEAENAELQPR